MTEPLRLRRHLNKQLRTCRRGRRATLRRQIALLSTTPRSGDDGSSGVREPRRPLPPSGGQSTSAL